MRTDNKEFHRSFGGDNFYAGENKNYQAAGEAVQKSIKDREKYLDKIVGSMVGGAAGDALGYAVEFLSLEEIKRKFGENGIREYVLDSVSGKALISDDTQMSLFTANGILVWETRARLSSIGGIPHNYIKLSYQDWLMTQKEDFQTGQHAPRGYGIGITSWLMDVPELYSRRAPGMTCLSALENAARDVEDYIKNPRNDSKGCGGIMRIAPWGLHSKWVEPGQGYEIDFAEVHWHEPTIKDLDKNGAILSAITHGHSLGYMPSAVLTHILNRIVYSKPEQSLKDIICEARDSVADIFQGDKHLPELCNIINKAMDLAENNRSDIENIAALGEGWVAEETLAIGLYCALRYQHDFSGGIIAAVNHNGDTTGAVTGNILGAINGYAAIEDKWTENLELHDVIVEMAVDLCHGCQMAELGHFYDEDWMRKYVEMRWKAKVPEPILFWREYEEFGYLSNWYDSPFVVEDFCYQHVEQYLMAQKAKLFHDAENYTAILRADSPGECKSLGRKVKPFDTKKWAGCRYDILKQGLTAKFTQNEELKSALLATGSALLAEASPYDGIYGIKLSAEEARALPPEEWQGQNLQGKALMEVRAELAGYKHK